MAVSTTEKESSDFFINFPTVFWFKEAGFYLIY